MTALLTPKQSQRARLSAPPHLNPIRKSVIRYAYIDWIPNLGFSHALTLNPNRDVTEEKLKKMFRAFCLEVDRHCYSRKSVHKLAPDDRFLAFAFTEQLASNAHIHAICRFDGWLPASLSLASHGSVIARRERSIALGR